MLHESPSDPVRLTAFQLGDQLYLRDGDTFEKIKQRDADVELAPGGSNSVIADGTQLTFRTATR